MRSAIIIPQTKKVVLINENGAIKIPGSFTCMETADLIFQFSVNRNKAIGPTDVVIDIHDNEYLLYQHNQNLPNSDNNCFALWIDMPIPGSNEFLPQIKIFDDIVHIMPKTETSFDFDSIENKIIWGNRKAMDSIIDILGKWLS